MEKFRWQNPYSSGSHVPVRSAQMSGSFILLSISALILRCGSGVGAVGGSKLDVSCGGWRQHASRSPESKPWRSKSASLSRAEVSSVERDSSLRILRILLATSWREDVTVWAGCVRRSVGGESSVSDPESELEVPEDSELFDSCLVFSKASPALALSSSTVGFGGS